MSLDNTDRWYLAATARSTTQLFPHYPALEHALDPTNPRPLPTWATPDQALDWFDAHRPSLMQLLHEETTDTDLAWRLPLALAPLLELGGHDQDWANAHTVGLAAAAQCGNQVGRARNQLGLADATSDPTQALSAYERALRLADQADDPWTAGFARRRIAELHWQAHQDLEALALLRRAWALFTDTDQGRGAALTLMSTARIHHQLHSPLPWALLDQAIDQLRALGDVWTTTYLQMERARMLADADPRWWEQARADVAAAVPVFASYRFAPGLDELSELGQRLALPAP